MNNKDKVELILDNYNELKGKKISLEYDMKLNTDLAAMDYNSMPSGEGGVPSSVAEEEVIRFCKEQCNSGNQSKLKLYKHTIERIESTLDNLNYEERKVIEWLYFDGLTRDEASAEMFQEFGKGSLPTIDRRKRTALNKLVSMQFHNVPIKTMVNAS